MTHRHQAFEMQKFTKPAASRFFYALMRWAAVVLALATVGFVIAGCDSAQASEEEAEALSSREWAGQQVCGPAATPVWHGDALECLRERTPVVTQ